MSVAVRWSKEDIERMKAELAAARLKLKEDGPVMMQVAVFLDQWVQRNFRELGGKAGGWAPYYYGGRLVNKDKANAQAMETRRYINTTAKMLQDTGALRLSFLPFIRKGVAGIGSDLPYSKAHEEGTDDLPQRRMLPKKDDVQADVFSILDNYVRIAVGAK